MLRRNQTTAAAAVKNKRKRPAVTFDMLKQNRGLPELFHNFPLIFKDQYRGRGHEVSDLRRLLEMYKRWQQRLFPFADFDAFIDSVEKIGYSHIVKSEIHEMRADILKKACKSYREWLNDVNDGLQDGHAQMAEDSEMHLALQPTLADVADAIDDDDTELLRIAFEEEARDQHDKAEDVDEDEMALQVDMLEDEELLELAMQTTQAE